ncbi:MAG TPA: DNA alkylation repair protein [Dehalococcoidales bacterium]|nr:DNA alkylation repair protein [Dehalococcoidales bacterium]
MNTAEQYAATIDRLKAMYNPVNRAGMARYGINPQNALGIPMTVVRPLAKTLGGNQALSEMFWQSGIHEARLLATLVGVPAQVTQEQMERWVAGFDSWDICDQCCMNLFALTPYAWAKAFEWGRREPEFVKRAGFVLIACLAVKDKKAEDSRFEQYFDLISEGSTDSRNFVRKAVNWALRHIGKRNQSLNRKAVTLAWEIKKIDSSAARWIAGDAIRELTGDAVQSRLKKRAEGAK